MPNDNTHILIADDDPDARTILTDYLTHCGYEVWTASDGQEALALAQSQTVDIALLDVRMPKLSGVDLIPRLKDLWPEIAIILLTAHAIVSQAVEAIRLGAFDYLEKPIALSRLRELVKHAWQIRQPQIKPGQHLTQREREVLQLLTEGRTDAEIADTLHLSKYTASTHVRNILTKLDVENRVQAALVWDRRKHGKD